MATFKEDYKIELYLEHFERWCITNNIEQSNWAVYLQPLLTGRAREAFLRLPVEDSKSYERIKEAIFKRYNRNPEEYRKAFRNSKKNENENHIKWLNRLKNDLERWLNSRKASSWEQMKNVIIEEQFKRNVDHNLKIRLEENVYESLEELGNAANRIKVASNF
jgi:hypothetical protein